MAGSEGSTGMVRESPRYLSLTAREAEVVALVADGLGNRDIAGRLHVTEGTVKKHLSAAFAKLGVRNRTQAALVVHELRHP
jgi:DNA-binding NarL/FixJ family response regulator